MTPPKGKSAESTTIRKSTSHLDPTRTTPLGTLRYAIEFYAAAIAAYDALKRKGMPVAPVAVNYLLGHSIELALKAYLLQHGAKLVHLKRNLGHNLVACLAEAGVAGLTDKMSLDDDDRELIAAFNNLYADKQFEYIETGPTNFPVYRLLRPFAQSLLIETVKAIPRGKVLLGRKAGELLLRMNDWSE
jgi:hypothetical protein